MTAPPPKPPAKYAIRPSPGELITSLATGNTYTIGAQIGEGAFGVVYSCTDVWNNELAAKVLKPVGTYEKVRSAAQAEFTKLLSLRNPYLTFVYDAFEYRDTFYIITERCHGPVGNLFSTIQDFDGQIWLLPVARCLLQAVQYLHLNGYVHQDIHVGNLFVAFARDELVPDEPGSIHFKLGDLGVAKVLGELDAQNTRAQWMLPPEALNPADYGAVGPTIDIYHTGLLLLQLAYSKLLRFTTDEVLAGKPRDMALSLPAPYGFGLEKALRRHVQYRTATAMELWRDLHTPGMTPTASPTDQ